MEQKIVEYKAVVPSIDQITIGADPEFFLSSNGVFVPAEVSGVTGTKSSPQALPGGGAVQIDGLALEFNIAPALSSDEFSKNITATLDEVRKIVDQGLEFNFIPAVTFTKPEFDKTSAENKKLGCDPDYDAYTMKEKTPPAGSDEKPFRTGAGHIHIGFTKDADPKDPRHIYDCAMIVQALDRYIGAYEGCWAAPNGRQRLYGSLGSFRPKSYGLEYRVLGNDWLKKPNVQKFIFEQARWVVDRMLSGWMSYPIGPSNKITEAYHLLGAHAGCPHGTSPARLIKKAYLEGELLTRYKSDCDSWVRRYSFGG